MYYKTPEFALLASAYRFFVNYMTAPTGKSITMLLYSLIGKYPDVTIESKLFSK